MKEKGVICIFLAFFITLGLVSASSYSIEYTQVGDKLVFKEIIDGKQISNQVSKDLLEKTSEGYYFVKKILFNSSYSDVEIKINLDNGFILEEDGVFPMNYITETDGQIISVVWQLREIKSGDIFPIFVKIHKSSSSYNSLWLILVVILLVVILLFVISYLMYKKNSLRRINKKSTPKKIISKKESIDYDYLLDTEKLVIEELKKADRNELWQKQIQNSTGYSKAKVSRLVKNLEARNLVVKIPFGNTNKIRLK